MRSLRIGRHRSEPPEFYRTPKEVWGFRVPRAVGTAVAVARRFIADNADLFGLHGVRGKLRDPRVIHSLGATHVIFRQVHAGRRIHRAYVTVHIGRGGRIYLSKNRAVPAEFLPVRVHFPLTRSRAIRKARRVLRGRDGVRVIGKVDEVWFPRGRRVRPALKVRLHSERPREEWIDRLRKGELLPDEPADKPSTTNLPARLQSTVDRQKHAPRRHWQLACQQFTEYHPITAQQLSGQTFVTKLWNLSRRLQRPYRS